MLKKTSSVIFLFLLSNSSLFRLFLWQNIFSPMNKEKKNAKWNKYKWINTNLFCLSLFFFCFCLSMIVFFLVAIDVQKHYSHLTIINNSVVYYIILVLCFFTILNWSVLIEIILTYMYDLIIRRRSLRERRRERERERCQYVYIFDHTIFYSRSDQ
jgi:hypothetical protein